MSKSVVAAAMERLLTCIIGEIDKSRCISNFSTVPKEY